VPSATELATIRGLALAHFLAVRRDGLNQFPPVSRDGIQHIVNLACEGHFGHRQGEARGLLNS
jgi:hypothetical protein